ncbi:unannotated protein [freshwater metagenome]|uniref:Unannotated protein n=1 Tax=freshwater metagenome TaxID=449393 RepID=A0A6J7IM45_9ZZZZ
MNREAPDGPSIPITAKVRPISSAVNPLRAESETTAEVAMKANTASARYSAGPKLVANDASVGAKNTTRVVATIPPMNAPMAEVAKACGALPFLAIRWPSNVPAMAVLLPGVFIRMPEMESPNRPPK